MLQNIHDRAQGIFAWIIVSLIAVPFALWGINEYFDPVQKIVVADVNGKEILDREFRYGVQQQRNQIRAMLKQDIDLSFMEKEIKERTLARMIEEEVLVQTSFNTGLRIGDALLARRINEFPAFQDNGVFSQPSYQKFLDSQGMTPPDFEMQIRRGLLTDQFREGVLRSTLLTKHDQQTRTRLEEQRRAVSYLLIATSQFKDAITSTDAEIEGYYNNHKKDYMTPEKVSVEYVELIGKDLVGNEKIDEETVKKSYQDHLASFTTPAEWHVRHILVAVDQSSPADKITAAKTKAQDLLAKIKAGQPFEEIAKQSSDDPNSAKKGGDLGWFGPGLMVKPFEEAVKTMTAGELRSEPLQSQFGFHIIELLEAKPEKIRPFEEVRDQLQQDMIKEKAEAAFYEQQEQFSNLAFENSNSLEPIEKVFNMKRKTTELFDRNTVGKDLLANRKVVEAAFSDPVLKEGFNSEVLDLGDQHIIVLRLKDHEEAVPKPLTEVKDKIVATLTAQKTKEKAQALGKTLLDEIKQKGDPQAAVTPYKLTWQPAKWIGRKDTSIPFNIVREAFKMGQPAEKNALYQGVELPNGDYAIVAVLAVKEGVESSPPAPKDSKAPDPKQQEQMYQQRALGETEFQQFVQQLKSEAEIKTYPQNIF